MTDEQKQIYALGLMMQRSLAQFDLQSLLVNCFQKSHAQDSMHFNCRSDYGIDLILERQFAHGSLSAPS